MSIRIHKAVGYGGYHPNNVALFEYLDEHGVDGEVNQLIVDNLPTKDHRDHLFLETENMAKTYEKSYPKQFLNCIHHCEYELDTHGYTLIIPPIYAEDWHRYDDSIDYFDANYNDPQTVVKILDGPIYPYSNWMDPETFEVIDTDYYYEERKYMTPTPIPSIPTSVKLIATKIGMDWKTLKPMVVTWWG